MEKLTITDIMYVGGRNLNLLNQSFELRKREEDFTFFKISSYHDPMQNEPKWFIYPNLTPGEIIIVSSKGKYSTNEDLLFMSKINGIGLTRDNLFMLPTLFPEIIKKYKSIVTLMGEEFLPNHLNGPKICPMISISSEYGVTNGGVSYDWWWSDRDDHEENQSLAFFKPSLRKSY